MKRSLLILSTIAVLLIPVSPVSGEDEGSIDASDPTKIYTYAGVGVKYTDYTNDESMWEVRATGNLGLGKSDMVMFELGYGWHDGDSVPGDDNGLTNARLRWFHLFKMDYSKVSGYRGMATQLDLQVAGELKGTDGQNVISAGALPAFGISDLWSFYCAFNLVGSWDKKFENYNGTGAGIAPLLVFAPDWWNGSYFQLWPNYTYFFSGELEDEGSGNVDLTVGGMFTPTISWAVTGQQQLDKDLNAFRRGRDTGLTNDWNIFASVTTYF